jgi:biotin synthase
MPLRKEVKDVIKKVFDGDLLSANDISFLFKVEPHSVDAGFVMGSADEINRKTSKGKAEVHAQIGLNLSPCPKNCTFCAFAAKNRVFNERNELSVEVVSEMAIRAENEGANALFLMGTGDYPLEKFVEISKEIRAKLNSETVMIANIGDFGYEQAQQLKDAGYKGIYHAVRMGEGTDTQISPETRLQTVKNAKEAGLLIGTCVEPVGPEHSIEEIIEKIIIGRDMRPCYSGAMRRIMIPNSEMAKYGMISEYRMAYLVSVVRLSMGVNLNGNCTHEPNLLGPTTGANLFWAEVGTNPRDTEVETSKGRGLDVETCRKILMEADFEMLEGPSVIYSENNIL